MISHIIALIRLLKRKKSSRDKITDKKKIYFKIRKLSPKTEDDGFVFPVINLEKPSDKCDLDALTKQQAQKPTTSVPVTQHHVFAEPKPVSCIFAFNTKTK